MRAHGRYHVIVMRERAVRHVINQKLHIQSAHFRQLLLVPPDHHTMSDIELEYRGGLIDMYPTDYVKRRTRRFEVPIVTVAFLKRCFPRVDIYLLDVIRKLALRVTDPLHSNPLHPSPEFMRACFMRRQPHYEGTLKEFKNSCLGEFPVDFEKWDLCVLRNLNEIEDIVKFGHMRGNERDKPVIYLLAWTNWARYLFADGAEFNVAIDEIHLVQGAYQQVPPMLHLNNLPAFRNARRLMDEKINSWRLLLIAKRVRAQKRKVAHADYLSAYFLDPISKRHVH